MQLVAQVFLQRLGSDYEDTYALVMDIIMFWFLVS